MRGDACDARRVRSTQDTPRGEAEEHEQCLRMSTVVSSRFADAREFADEVVNTPSAPIISCGMRRERGERRARRESTSVQRER